MSNSGFYGSRIKATEVYVTLRQLTKSDYTEERGDDAGVLYCKAVYPLYEYDKSGKKTQNQVGWKYQCVVKERNNATVFVKVTDMNCIVTEAELKQGPVPLLFADFRGIWWVNAKGYLELSCKAELAERAPAEVA